MRVSLTKFKPEVKKTDSQATKGNEKKQFVFKWTPKKEVKTIKTSLWQPKFKEKEEREGQVKINYIWPQIKNMRRDGLTTILFNADMIDQKSGFNLTSINETTLDVRVNLSNKTIEESKYKPENLANLTWFPKQYVEQTLELQIVLAHPLELARNGANDVLQIEFKKPELFAVKTQGWVFSEDFLVLHKKLRP